MKPEHEFMNVIEKNGMSAEGFRGMLDDMIGLMESCGDNMLSEIKSNQKTNRIYEFLCSVCNSTLPMSEEKFERELEKKCFAGQRGKYFKINYFENRENPDSWKEVCSAFYDIIQEEIDDLTVEAQNVSDERAQEIEDRINNLQSLLSMPLENKRIALQAFDKFFEGNFEWFPEFIGSVVGALASMEEYRMAYDFIGLDNVKEIRWDS